MRNITRPCVKHAKALDMQHAGVCMRQDSGSEFLWGGIRLLFGSCVE